MAEIHITCHDAENNNLPNACMHCGAQATVHRIANMNGAKIPLPFCAKHQSGIVQHWARTAGFVVLSIWMAGIFIVTYDLEAALRMTGRSPYLVPAFCVASALWFLLWFFACLIWKPGQIRCKDRTEDGVILTGVSEQYVNAFRGYRERTCGPDEPGREEN
jgi:hypothetical protein